MRVAVTGGTGVVGTALVHHLVESGHDVWALARSAESSAKLAGMGARVVHGDVLDPNALDRLMMGSRRVFHVAGVNESCPRDPARMWRLNVEGALAVLEAGARAGVERLIHTSSAVTIGEDQGTVGAETSRHRGVFLSEYERSKTVAERLVFDNSGEVEVVAVNPSSVQGPGRSTGTGSLLLAAARGSVPFMVDTTISLVDIEDCARGHVLAADRGVPGQRYILSGATLTIRDTIRVLNRLLGRRSRPWFIRPRVVTTAAPVIDAGMRVLGRRSLLCAESARVLLHGHRYDGSRATEALGLVYTPVEQTLQRTFDWFRSEGLVD